MKTFLRVEAAGILAGAVALHYYLEGNWWVFGLFAVVPELAWLAYLKRDVKARWPNFLYDVLHMYITPIVIAFALWPYEPVFLLGWAANIACTRLLGYGFKSAKVIQGQTTN